MNRRVLLVDNDSALRLMVERHLRDLGYEVETSDEPREAIERAVLGRFDVVVTSVGLPGLAPSRLVEALGGVRPAPAIVTLRYGEAEAERFRPGRGPSLHLEELSGPLVRADLEAAVVRAVRRRHEDTCGKLGHDRPAAAGRGGLGACGDRRRAGVGAGARIGRYELGERVGAGPIGTVYRCAEPSSDRPLAVKVVRRELAERTGRRARWLDRFRRAAGAAASVSHPALAPLVDYGLDEELGCIYFVSELVEGSSLALRLAEGGPLGPAAAVRALFGVADGLAAVHEASLLHRRVSPSNVVVAPDGSGRLTDLAVASALAWDLMPVGDRPEGPGYAAPEQLRSARPDGRAEQFSLGAVLFEALTGRPCFAGSSVRARTQAIVGAAAPTLAAAGAAAPPCLERLVGRLLEKSPASRFASDDELLEALAGCGEELGLALKRSAATSGLL